jgi:hypothetical protein
VVVLLSKPLDISVVQVFSFIYNPESVSISLQLKQILLKLVAARIARTSMKQEKINYSCSRLNNRNSASHPVG